MNTLHRASTTLFRTAFAVSLAFGGLACTSVYRPSTSAGTIELPAGGIAGISAPYLLRGSYTVKDLDSGAEMLVHVDSGPDWIPVRRSLPPGRYSISLNPGFHIHWLTRPRPLEGAEPIVAADGPKLVVIHPGKLATVQLRSVTPSRELAMR